ncbi:hypothetical protein Syun_003771 [Stephania yunnanensis]|uniref:Uncharacterized protein n=1 Tax=Stephania yunnanensis TaxID=152371 RepID=A0AAP0L5R0_9MAGN
MESFNSYEELQHLVDVHSEDSISSRSHEHESNAQHMSKQRLSSTTSTLA